MAVELIAGLGLFKSMFDAAKGLKDINDAAIRNAAVIELQEKILAAREQQSALAEHVRELEEEVARFKAWDAEKQRYSLVQFAPGVVAYVLKKSEAHGEPGHALCTNCYQRGVKSILQSNGDPYIDDHAFECSSCDAAIKTPRNNPPEFAD